MNSVSIELKAEIDGLGPQSHNAPEAATQRHYPSPAVFQPPSLRLR